MPHAHRLSLKARLLLMHTGIWLVGFVAAGVLILNHGRAAVRAESASNLELVQGILGSVLADGSALRSRERLDEIARAVSRVRHVRAVPVGPAVSGPRTPAPPVHRVPEWFATLVAPPPQALPRMTLPASGRSPTLMIEADPSDEILEAWEEARTFLAIAGWVFMLVCTMIYLVIRHGLRPLGQLLAAFEGLERDDFSTRVSEQTVPELARIHRGFNRMAAVLGSAVERNRWLAARLVSVQEDERRRLARELHDDMGPDLFDITVRTAAIGSLLARKMYAEVPAQLQAIERTVAEAQGRVRQILRRLRPLALDELGLGQALDDLVYTWRSRCPGIQWSLEARGRLEGLNDTLRVTVYRVVQECLTNIARHAEARSACLRIEVEQDPQPGRASVWVEDDGRGMAPGARFGLGLTGVQERVQALGGKLRVEGRDGPGTRIHAWVPVHPEPETQRDPCDRAPAGFTR